MKNLLRNFATLTFVTVSLQGCQEKEGFYAKALLGATAGEPSANVIVTPNDVPPEGEVIPTPGSLCENGSSENVICNPLGGGDNNPTTPGSSRQGLIAYLYEGENQWNHMDRYIADGFKHPEIIYFSNFNVPTRSFDEGFGFSSGDFLKNRMGEKLIEWFGIFAQGNLTLPDDASEGSYHIVTLSDDGIRISVDGKMIINNPSTHAPTINCASELVNMRKGEDKKFELGYFQGPRYHIALMTFIKKIDDPASFQNGSYCSGSNTDNLISQGYTVMSPTWFTLPSGY